ncbi:diguanylate cyclase domain-containing protein [Bradyrhizobium sp. AZCC 1699]|uniref:diguanylate cyclase domain-containing protein n=1 Tax=unclassified Bradyrhizobium TaxID=2631580 RepID=UPI003FA57294
MTGLLNRRALIRPPNRPCPRCAMRTSVLTCDIDCFKAINDRFGHVRRKVLIAISEVLRSLPSEDGCSWQGSGGGVCDSDDRVSQAALRPICGRARQALPRKSQTKRVRLA